MKIRAAFLAAAFSLPLFAGAGIAATAPVSVVDAARLGDREAVRSALMSGANPNLAEGDDTSALMWAAEHNDVPMADLLLRSGADVNAANEYGATALYVASASANADMTAKLLAAHADPNAHLSSYETPLMEAARQGKLATVRLLLAAHADPNAKESNGGQTALMWAVSERHSQVTDALVKGGADIAIHSNSGFTALMFAAQQGDTDSTRILLDTGAKVNEVMPKTGLTPLILASAMAHGDCFATIDRCAQPTIIENPTGYAALAGLLLDKGANPDAVDAQGFTALHHAARDSRALSIVATLLAHKANPNIRLHQQRPMTAASGVSLDGATPVALAAEINNLEAIKLLVEGGADPLVGTLQNTTPLILAAGGGTDLARPRAADERATAVETVKFLIAHGANVNSAGQFGWTALHAAAYQGLDDVIDYLASSGAKLDTKDTFGQTALSISYAVITKDIGDAYYQTPRVFRQETADRLLKLGATPLEKSGVVVSVIQQPKE